VRLFFCVAFCMLAAACASPEPAVVSAPAPGSAGASSSAPASAGNPQSQSYAEDLMAYLGRLRTMNEAALAGEAARMRRDASDLARVKAALALSLSSQADEGDIIELVEPVTRRSAANDVRAMAVLLNTNAQERRRLRQRAANAAGELREERKLAEAQKQRAEQLQQKLDALTDLERSLASREAQTR
jgi:hypothetical protein